MYVTGFIGVKTRQRLSPQQRAPLCNVVLLIVRTKHKVAQKLRCRLLRLRPRQMELLYQRHTQL